MGSGEAVNCAIIYMAIVLSDHLKLRLKIRKINKFLPGKIIKESSEIYFDIETNHWIAIKYDKYAGKIRPMVAVFDKINGDIKIITVYPSDKNEILLRVEKGRWINEKQKN